MRICVCDTDQAICNELIKNINDCFLSGEAFSVMCFYSPEEMLEYEKGTKSFDAYFINAAHNGITAAEIIRCKHKEAIIVLSGDSEEYIYDAFKTEALYYLKKPFGKDEFSETFRRIIAKSRSLKPLLHLRWKSERYVLNISDIIYIEGYNRHLTFYTTDGEYTSVGKLQNILEKLCIHGFLRIHQGYAVNMKHIIKFGTNEVTVRGGTKVMISSRMRSDALKIYDDYLKEHE